MGKNKLTKKMLKEAEIAMRKFIYQKEVKMFNEAFKDCKKQGRYIFDTKHGKECWIYGKQ